MKLQTLLEKIFPPSQPFQLTSAQKNILKHSRGPAWVIAGPGSGKTEILALMVLRLLYVDNDPTVQETRVPPESIFITTFTEKAARNLEDRISHYRGKIISQCPQLASIDVSKLRIGTLHGLCNDILQECRAPSYQNVRLMDEFEQALFIYEHVSIVRSPDKINDHPFWEHFSFMFEPHIWRPSYTNLPRKWDMVSVLMRLFNRLVEDRVSLDKLEVKGGHLARLVKLYEEYFNELNENHRCDFAHLQKYFLEFLDTELGKVFLNGSRGAEQSGIQWVLVDEYQDTNLIQEEIYLTIANRKPFNIMVVGDDDQALYRFRGGSVECMVTFDQACNTFLKIPPSQVKRYPLVENFRSHPGIVEFCNKYITAFSSMNDPSARVTGKKPLVPMSNITGDYSVVLQLSAEKLDTLAKKFAEIVEQLVKHKIVHDYSQCCLLLSSTKETKQNALPFVKALHDRNIPVYNPRNKTFLQQEEVQGVIGTILEILDPQGSSLPNKPRELVRFVESCRTVYQQLADSHQELREYVSNCLSKLKEAEPGKILKANLQEIVYYILALSPFKDWQNDPLRRMRLGRLTALFESYASLPVANFPDIFRGNLKTSSIARGKIDDAWLRNFYYLFLGYLSRIGMDEIEDDDSICPLGMFPIMTIHQAKGLQFPFVFVGHMGKKPTVSISHKLETEFSKFPRIHPRIFSPQSEQLRAELDLIRQYYVAYSRAEYALILVGTKSHFTKGAIPCGPDKDWLRRVTDPL